VGIREELFSRAVIPLPFEVARGGFTEAVGDHGCICPPSPLCWPYPHGGPYTSRNRISLASQLLRSWPPHPGRHHVFGSTMNAMGGHPEARHGGWPGGAVCDRDTAGTEGNGESVSALGVQRSKQRLNRSGSLKPIWTFVANMDICYAITG